MKTTIIKLIRSFEYTATEKQAIINCVFYQTRRTGTSTWSFDIIQDAIEQCLIDGNTTATNLIKHIELKAKQNQYKSGISFDEYMLEADLENTNTGLDFYEYSGKTGHVAREDDTNLIF